MFNICVNLFCSQATGEDFSVEPDDERRPFRALLDVGLVRTTTGNRVFGALKVYFQICYLQFDCSWQCLS